MIDGLSTLTQVPMLLGAIVVLTLSLGAALGMVVTSWLHSRTSVDDELDEELPDELPEDSADVEPVEFDPPNVSLSFMDWIRAGRHLQKQRKAAKRGWVKWYRVGANFSRPKWVKPVRDGSGTPKVTDGDQPYYFEKDAMVVDERTGAYVAVHPEGEADPINLANRAYPGIETDLVERLLNLEAENDPTTSLFDFGGMSTQQMMWLGIGALFILFAAARYAM